MTPCSGLKVTTLSPNYLIFHNVFSLSRVLHDLHHEGYPLEPDHIAALSPYLT